MRICFGRLIVYVTPENWINANDSHTGTHSRIQSALNRAPSISISKTERLDTNAERHEQHDVLWPCDHWHNDYFGGATQIIMRIHSWIKNRATHARLAWLGVNSVLLMVWLVIEWIIHLIGGQCGPLSITSAGADHLDSVSHEHTTTICWPKNVVYN